MSIRQSNHDKETWIVNLPNGKFFPIIMKERNLRKLYPPNF